MNIIDDDIERIRTRFGAIKWALDERLRYLGTGNGLGCFFQVFFPDKGHPVSDFRKLTTR